MPHTSSPTLISVLRTVLYLLEQDGIVRPELSIVLEFRQVTLKLISELQAHSIQDELVRPTTRGIDRNAALKAVTGDR